MFWQILQLLFLFEIKKSFYKVIFFGYIPFDILHITVRMFTCEMKFISYSRIIFITFFENYDIKNNKHYLYYCLLSANYLLS